MLIGVPRAIKNSEFRIGLTPAGARELSARGHQVLVQRDAGAGIGLANEAYEAAGARIVETAAEVYARAELVIKVKEPRAAECAMLRPGQVLFAYLHLAPDPEQTRALLASGCTAIAYETVTDAHGGLPLLAPMSEVAGRMAIQAGAHALEKAQGGSGVLLGGVPGVKPAEVMVIGAGTVGLNAARMAMGLGARVTVLDRSLERLKYIDELYGQRLATILSSAEAISERLPQADLVVGAVLVPGAAAPRLVSRAQLKLMRPGWCWWTWPSTRAVASRPVAPPPTRIRPTRSMASSTTAWPTCPARWRAPPPSPWPMPPCPTRWRWPTRARGRPWRTIPTCATG